MRKILVISTVAAVFVGALLYALRDEPAKRDALAEAESERGREEVLPAQKSAGYEAFEVEAPPFIAASETPLNAQFPSGTPVVRAEHLAPDPRPDDAADEAAAAYDEPAEHTATRGRWLQEKTDLTWTKQIADTIRATVESGLEGEVRYSYLDCRQTVCRGVIKFTDQLDAQAFLDAFKEDDELRIGLESHDPTFDGNGLDRSDHSYEMLLARVDGAGPNANPPPSSSEQTAAGDGEELAPVSPADCAEVAIVPRSD